MRYTSKIKIDVWSRLALLLHMEPNTCSEIKRKCTAQSDDFNTCIVQEWLDQGEASWASLVTALNDDLVTKVDIANKIAEDHPSHVR